MIAARRCLVTKRFKYDLSVFFLFLSTAQQRGVKINVARFTAPLQVELSCELPRLLRIDNSWHFRLLRALLWKWLAVRFTFFLTFIWYLANRSLQRLSRICIFFKIPSFEIFLFLFKYLPFSSCSAIFNCRLTISNSC